MRLAPKPLLGISACLLGHPVRWDGGHRRDRSCVELLGPSVEWLPVCPEVELGMPVPRPPIQLTGRPAAPRLREVASGEDWTLRMRALAEARVASLARLGIAGFVLKRGSPSCGLAGVPVHRARGAPASDGVGAFARVLRERLRALPVVEAERLHDPAGRRAFLARVRAYARGQGERGSRSKSGSGSGSRSPSRSA